MAFEGFEKLKKELTLQAIQELKDENSNDIIILKKIEQFEKSLSF